MFRVNGNSLTTQMLAARITRRYDPLPRSRSWVSSRAPSKLKVTPTNQRTVFKQQRIYPRKTHPVTDKAELIASLCYALNDFSKSAVDRWLAAGKTHLLDPATLPFAQHLFQDCQRQIASRGMPFVKAVAAAQVAAIGQLNDDTRQVPAPRASRRRSINFAGW